MYHLRQESDKFGNNVLYNSSKNDLKTKIHIEKYTDIHYQTLIMFEWKGRRWNSIDEAMLSAKVSVVDPVRASQVTQDDVVQGDKLVHLSAQHLVYWNMIRRRVLLEITNASTTSMYKV